MLKKDSLRWDHIKPAFNFTVLVASLGYFVDMYDLVLFGIVRVESRGRFFDKLPLASANGYRVGKVFGLQPFISALFLG